MIECPSPPRWRAWLDGAVIEADRGPMAAHLEACRNCQQLLDGEAGVERAWAAAATVAPAEPALARAIEQLRDCRPVSPTPESNYPMKIGDYEILGEVGRGGMGVVLRAFDTKLHRVVAIKMLASHLAANAAGRERFLREARAAAAIAHEHVITIHAVEEAADKTPYIVMHYVAGRSLQDRLDRDGPLEIKEILRIGMQAAAGLHAAHMQGIVHRDIKPANILLENGVERVKLADFGLARAADDASLTASGVLAGSPMFMSPEQAGAEAIDQRADLFALGAVLYTMAAGHPPFRASTALAVLKRVCEATPRPLRQINGEIPAWFEAIVFKLLEKRPADRFNSAAEVADLLGQHLRHLQHPESPKPASLPQNWKQQGSAVARAAWHHVEHLQPPTWDSVKSWFSRVGSWLLGDDRSLGLTALTFLLFITAFTHPPQSLMLIPISYVVSRAILELAANRGQQMGARRWFVYPSLLFVDFGLLWATLLTPPFFGGLIAYRVAEWNHQPAHPGALTAMDANAAAHSACLIAAWTAAVWWTLLGLVMTRWPGAVRAVFHPFAGWFNGNHAMWLVYVGLALGAAAASIVRLGLELPMMT